MPKGCDQRSLEELTTLLKGRASDESARVIGAVEDVKIDEFVTELASKLEDSFQKDTDYWKHIIPGKQLLSKFGHAANIPVDRLKRSYIKHASEGSTSPFQSIIDIFDGFSNYS